jgi:L-rhamnose isomerase/sugar isomerase
MIDQCHNIEGKMAPMIPVGDQLPGSLRQGAARAARPAGRAAMAGEVLLAHKLLTDAFRTDVRPLLAAGARGTGRAGGPDCGVQGVGLRGEDPQGAGDCVDERGISIKTEV